MLITGVSQFTKVSIFSDLNNLSDISIHPAFNALTGITQEELDPFSLLQYIESGQFDNYWFSTGTPAFLVNLIRQQGQFTLDEGAYTSLSSLAQFDVNHLEFKPMLFQTGYLTLASVNFSEGICKLKYPNKEVKASLEQYLLAAYRHGQVGDALPLVFQLRDTFNDNNIDQVVTIINTLFSTIPSPLWRGATELHYHALIHLSFSLLGTYMQSEVNSSNGRCDALVQTDTYIYALEFKLNKSAAEALQQITDKQYLAPYALSSKRKIAVGINFSSKKKQVADFLVDEI